MPLCSCQEPAAGVSQCQREFVSAASWEMSPLWSLVRLVWLSGAPQETGTRAPQELPYILLQPHLVDAQRLLLRLWIQQYKRTHLFPTCADKEVIIAVPGALSTPKPTLNCHFIRLFEEQDTVTAQDLTRNYTLDTVRDNLSYQSPGLIRVSDEWWFLNNPLFQGGWLIFVYGWIAIMKGFWHLPLLRLTFPRTSCYTCCEWNLLCQNVFPPFKCDLRILFNLIEFFLL